MKKNSKKFTSDLALGIFVFLCCSSLIYIAICGYLGHFDVAATSRGMLQFYVFTGILAAFGIGFVVSYLAIAICNLWEWLDDKPNIQAMIIATVVIVFSVMVCYVLNAFGGRYAYPNNLIYFIVILGSLFITAFYIGVVIMILGSIANLFLCLKDWIKRKINKRKAKRQTQH